MSRSSVVGSRIRSIRSVTSGAHTKQATLIFLEHSLDSPDGVSSAASRGLQHALEAQFSRRNHSLDPACCRLPDLETALLPRGRWAGTRHLARLVFAHYSAADMGEANYESVRVLLRDEEDSSS